MQNTPPAFSHVTPTSVIGGRSYYSHFMDEETEAASDMPRFIRVLVMEPGCEPEIVHSKVTTILNCGSACLCHPGVQKGGRPMNSECSTNTHKAPWGLPRTFHFLLVFQCTQSFFPFCYLSLINLFSMTDGN